jgi:hypothetical protein
LIWPSSRAIRANSRRSVSMGVRHICSRV